ncbi:hypothetical protein HMI54_010399 [Coelomomyces lativittatus]|nr:hypothetical protein HMI56_004792 [Coelomomyces lativittatus]KAJ1516207.1 hypothetical protein HMI54_010399 [Coelomomyces lativittatus]
MAPSSISCFSPNLSTQRLSRSAASPDIKDDPFVIIGQQRMDPWDVQPGTRSSNSGSPNYNPFSPNTENLRFTQATFSSSLKQKPYQPIRVRKGDGEKYTIRSPTSPRHSINCGYAFTSMRQHGSVDDGASKRASMKNSEAVEEKDSQQSAFLEKRSLQNTTLGRKGEEHKGISEKDKEPLHQMNSLNHQFEESKIRNKEAKDGNKDPEWKEGKKTRNSPALHIHTSRRFPSPSPSSTSNQGALKYTDLSEPSWSPLEAEKPLTTRPHTRTTTWSSYSEPEPLLAPIPTAFSHSSLDFCFEDGPLLPDVDTSNIVVSIEKELSQARLRELQAVQQSLSLRAKAQELKLQNQQLNDHVAWLNFRICEEREERVKAQVNLEALERKWKKNFTEHQSLINEVQGYRLLRSRLDRELKLISPMSQTQEYINKTTH